MDSGEVLPRWAKSPFRNDWEFENVFARAPDTGRESMGGRRQVRVLHRFRVTESVWHVCWVDSQDYYGHGFFKYEDGRFIPVDEPPQE
jgi:hypothetical protein